MTDNSHRRFQMMAAQELRDLAHKLEMGQRAALKVGGRRNEDGTFTFSVTHAAVPESAQTLTCHDIQGNRYDIPVEDP